MQGGGTEIFMACANIEQYTGINIADRFEGVKRDLYLSCWEYMHKAFGDNVEFERMKYQILLCPETRDYLYRAPEPSRYIYGSRPVLEKIVYDLTAPLKTEREKALAILVYIRDLYKTNCMLRGSDGNDWIDYFYGGTEEELIKKGEWLCERVARLMAALCEIAGMPGRVIFHMANGHLTSEIFLEGKWSYFDPRKGLFYLDEEGKIMSLAELMDNPDMIYRQSDEVYSYHSDYWTLEDCNDGNHDRYFNQNEIQCLVPYSLADSYKYHFNWMPATRLEDHHTAERDLAHDEYVKCIKEYLG